MAKEFLSDVALLRKTAEQTFNDAKGSVDERDVERFMTNDDYADLFLQWSKCEEDAIKLVMKCFKWRCENRVNDLSVESIGEDVFKQGLVFLHGQSIKGSRVLHLRVGKMEKKDRETNMKLLIFWLERIQRKEPGELITFILDTSDSSILNSDMGFTTFIIECFSTYFPFMLERIIVFNLPTILNSIWKLVGKMLSAEQREATVLCGKDELRLYIDPENIPIRMGGKSEFEFSFPPFPDDLDREF